jgi:hypothetical protein
MHRVVQLQQAMLTDVLVDCPVGAVERAPCGDRLLHVGGADIRPGSKYLLGRRVDVVAGLARRRFSQFTVDIPTGWG